MYYWGDFSSCLLFQHWHISIFWRTDIFPAQMLVGNNSFLASRGYVSFLARQIQRLRGKKHPTPKWVWSCFNPFSLPPTRGDLGHLCACSWFVFKATRAGIWSMVSYMGSSSPNHRAELEIIFKYKKTSKSWTLKLKYNLFWYKNFLTPMQFSHNIHFP